MKKLGFKWVVGSSIIAYLMIGLEILFMISPVALYYYSIYSPVLKWLDNFPLLSWLTKFVFPHFCETSSFLINNVSTFGMILFSLGTTLFVISLCQLYYSRIIRKQVANKGLYRHIRHPQYLAFAIMGMGSFLFWPRIVVLYLYVGMLLIYLWLAKREEKTCIAEFGDDYRKYLKRTDRFVPGDRKISNLQLKFDNIRYPFKSEAVFLLLVSALLLVGTTTDLLRDVSIRHLYTFSTDGILAISLTAQESENFEKVYELILSDSLLAAEIHEHYETSNYKIISYVAPVNLLVPELPFSIPIDGKQHSHFLYQRTGNEVYKVLFCEPYVLIECINSDIDLIKRTETISPFLEVQVDLNTKQLNKISTSSFTMKWEGVRTPLF